MLPQSSMFAVILENKTLHEKISKRFGTLISPGQECSCSFQMLANHLYKTRRKLKLVRVL